MYNIMRHISNNVFNFLHCYVSFNVQSFYLIVLTFRFSYLLLIFECNFFHFIETIFLLQSLYRDGLLLFSSRARKITWYRWQWFSRIDPGIKIHVSLVSLARCIQRRPISRRVCTKIINNHSEYLSELNRVRRSWRCRVVFLVLDRFDTKNVIENVCLKKMNK